MRGAHGRNDQWDEGLALFALLTALANAHVEGRLEEKLLHVSKAKAVDRR